jgi:M6 family metalloprotease-like protein
MRKFSRALIAIGLVTLISFTSTGANAATPKSGVRCSKVNAKFKANASLTLQCKRKSGKLVWVKVASSTPAPKPTGVDSGNYIDDPAVSTITIYSGGPGVSGSSQGAKSVPLPGTPPTGSNSYNVKIWIYNPESQGQAAGSPGIFLNTNGMGWKFLEIATTGYLIENWEPGKYSIDTVEPNGNSSKYLRHTYSLTVSTSGSVTVEGLSPNDQGFFTLTLDLATKAPAFSPANECQLSYQAGGDPQMSSGFPRGANRLPGKGRISALIVPVDFADVPGLGNPEKVFFDMAKGTHDFYFKQSAGGVSFDFKIVKKWQRQKFASNSFNLGKWNGGDASGYYKTLIRAADPIVDYAQFDVVYFLSPPTIPWDSIAYGPAFPTTVQTGDGPLSAGTFSGADAYQNNGVVSPGWKWMSHETGHLFGIHDLYTNGVPAKFGSWDLMSMNWSNQFIEFTAWNRYISGWLTDSQVACLTLSKLSSSETSITLTPLERNDSLLKAIAIPLSQYKILVVESRRAEGMDHSSSQQKAGTLVYTVDMRVQSIKGGWSVVTPDRSADKVNFLDAALQVGETVSIDGVTVTVVAQDSTGDKVVVSKK